MDNESFGKDIGLLHEVIITGRKVGADRAFYTELAQDEKLFEQVVRLVARKGCAPTISQERAREIMGKNFFGVEEAIKHFGVNPTKEQLDALKEVPFSEEMLERSKDTHVLVAVFPISILEIRGKVEESLFYSHEDAWYNDESFAKEQAGVIWQLVRKIPVDNSTSKNWTDQQALLAKDEEIPSARVVVYTIIGYYLATGERLFEHIYVRTSTVDSDGDRVIVGDFDSDGLSINSHWGDGRGNGLGVASARKLV